MLNSTVLEVVLGLTFCFASVSLIVSSINEAISSILDLRAKNLRTGVKSLLNDPAFTGLALQVYNHALVNPRSNGQASDVKTLTSSPSYIEPLQFAKALIDTIYANAGTNVSLKQSIDKIQDQQLRVMLLGIYARASGGVNQIQNELAAWFDNGMARVAGVYKRKTQLTCFMIAIVVAAIFNVDAIYLFKALWLHPEYLSRINIPGDMPAALTSLHTLPIGWDNFPPHLAALPITIIGCMITASSALFGAPFWFDMLQQFVQLRGTGDKPKTIS